jgi:hypothetical protein
MNYTNQAYKPNSRKLTQLFIAGFVATAVMVAFAYMLRAVGVPAPDFGAQYGAIFNGQTYPSAFDGKWWGGLVWHFINGKFRASKIMQERALSNPKIKVRWNTVISEILGADGKVTAIRLRDTVTGAESTLDTKAVFVAIGHDPRSELFRDQVDLDDNGYVLVDPPSTRTNQPGVFAAGDLVDHTYQQAITAAGTGSAAALDAERYIAALVH